MKKNMYVVLTVLVLLAFAVPVAFAQSDVPGGEIVDPVQLYVIGLIASAVVYGVKMLNANIKI